MTDPTERGSPGIGGHHHRRDKRPFLICCSFPILIDGLQCRFSCCAPESLKSTPLDLDPPLLPGCPLIVPRSRRVSSSSPHCRIWTVVQGSTATQSPSLFWEEDVPLP
ncbi:hypothetical protein DPEC_G00134800 [Dallia pectoralis]|uniref:Uncharacterized protein n=1 Tax=Dallia pectoralis TaxID=75939 RepID=A0ACC2GS56_DALPE|nr:hypothetical protein DPEC_G00134800 [Dallia pectoralis]